MTDGKYLRFTLLIILSVLLVAGAFSSPMLRPPSGIRSLEDLFSHEHGNKPERVGLESIHPYFIVTGAAHTHYLRERVYVEYRNGTWIPGNFSKEKGSRARPFIPTVPHHTWEDRIHITLFPALSGNLYTAPNSFNISVPSTWYPDSGIFSVNGSVSSYSFNSVEYTFDPYILLNLTSPKITGYLQSPPDKRLRELAENITAGFMSDYERAEAIALYLRRNYRYTRGYAKNNMSVEDFLFETHRGGSLEFAAAFVVLAREVGLPARLVEGFKIMALPFKQTVTEGNRWFWAEVYFNSAGWLIFDPLSPEDPNVFRPFELMVTPQNQSLNPNTTVKLNLTVENIDVNESIAITVKSPIGRLRTSLGPGEHTISIGRVTSPGRYPIIVGGSREVNGTLLKEWGIAWVEVPGSPQLRTEEAPLEMRPGDAAGLMLHVKGIGETNLTLNSPFKNTELTFPWRLVPPAGAGSFDSILILDIPRNAIPGWYLFSVRASAMNGTYTMFLPLRVVTSPDVTVLPGWDRVDAGRVLSLNGSTSTGGGEIYATAIYGGRLHVIGMTGVRNGLFVLKCEIPATVSPGYMTVSVHYVPPMGSPILKEVMPLTVYVRGTSRISIPRMEVFNTGTAIIRGLLYSGNGEPITGNLTYYLDGRLFGSTTAIKGGFEINITLKEPGTHILTVRYGGNEEYQAALAESTITAVKVGFKPVKKALLGENLEIEGDVAGMKSGILKVLSSFGKSTNVTVMDGAFKLDTGPLDEVGIQTIDVYWERSLLASLNFTVFSPTEIKVLKGIVRSEKVMGIPIALVDGLGRRVTGVTLTAESEGMNLSAITDSQGVALFIIPLKGHEKNITLTVRFAGAGYYLPTSKRITLRTSGSGNEWWYIVIPLLIALTLVMLHRQKRGEREPEGGVAIVFPDGIPLFREEETVEFEVGCESEVYVDGEIIGRGRRFGIHLKAGEHGIEAVCGKKIGRARVRVVERYQHSVAELYEACFLRWLNSLGLKTAEKTPRELVSVLEHELYTGEGMEKLTEIFERARYGRGDINRREFVEFYRILRRTVRGECNV